MLLLFFAAAQTSEARDLYVNPLTGDERNDGLTAAPGAAGIGPVKTIHRGVRYAQPGDTVHLAPLDEPYHESPVFHDRICPADKPITLDGHGATISGAEPMDLATWEQVAPGRFRKTTLLRMDSAILGRWFFRIDGRMQHMGRTSKGPSAKLKPPAELQPGEWTFVEAEDAFYVQLDPAKQPADYVIEAPMRSAGVQISGRNENLVIRNLNTQHVYNDGFNIHGYCRGVLLENVSAVECGDDGISAHDDCRIKVEGFTSIGNSTGFCHTNDSHSDSNRVIIRDCLGFDVFVLDTGRHSLTNSIVYSSASSSVVVMGPRAGKDGVIPPGACTLKLSNSAIVRRGRNTSMRFGAGSIVGALHCVFAGFDISADGMSFTLEESVVASIGDRRSKLTVGKSTRTADFHNRYDVDVDENFFVQAQADVRDRSESRSMTIKFREPFDGTLLEPGNYSGGVDASKLPKP
ncbi:MAG: hypothetical protein C0483_15220 [Pirellula sp.]|nr:hypothetical protein [Pirellula sp.]